MYYRYEIFIIFSLFPYICVGNDIALIRLQPTSPVRKTAVEIKVFKLGARKPHTKAL